ncbi:MAG TPA: phosphoribosylaminoimidazolesuccinocarboxamide synthase [Actinophytocola sp.]|uniref:phosphoribosylaminoimidazolesuccinocarboxamide synthase n=1 Tax=Actinophytocola sp. TaxID=1872138 RepID=UPI002DBE3CFE|nr:phosphoribosylaminoimidazolesuccinocarboxamide synthase [Actinophytocola sp.]HEU5475452.1 phosphoribosylaminoimidazolesuccinocarboxamide synthase [Actinophytocola sp.]
MDPLTHLNAGKIRDLYAYGADLLLVASDRISVYDVVLPTAIPDKGALLTRLSVWWFERSADIAPNHLISATDVPAEFAGRAMRCRRLTMLPVECIARGYLAGLGLREYQETGSVSGIPLPPGLQEGSELPEPIFTPTTKATGGGHDEFITFDDVVHLVGKETAGRLRELTLALYRRGAEHAREKGIIVADTKFEFGVDGNGELVLGDELLTSDSSRFWPASEWRPGGPQRSYDKQFVRDWAAGTGWNKEPPGPDVPDHIVAATRARYVEAYELITGMTWSAPGAPS